MGAIPSAALRGGRISGLPSPHHATRPLASEEIPPHLVMQAWEKYSIQHVSKAGRAARIGAIIRKRPSFPAKPDHGHHFFMTTSCSVRSMGTSPFKRRRPSARVPVRRQNQQTLSEVFFTCEICHIRETLAETSVLRDESFTGLERSN